MFHRFSSWWRALSVVLLGLATLTWPSAAHASSTPAWSVVSQGSVATLSNAGASSLRLVLGLSHATPTTVALSVYPSIVYRSEVSALVDGVGPTSSPIATTTLTNPTCASGSTLALTISIFSAGGEGASHHCGSQPLHLRLPCASDSCDGVYPLRIAVTTNGVARVEWSMFAVQATSVLHPLLVDYIAVVDPSSWGLETLAEDNLAVITRFAAVPLTVAVDYRPLSRALLSSSSRTWRHALAGSLASPEHRAVIAPPSNIDFAGLAANGFPGEVPRQINLSNQLLHDVTGRNRDQPLFIESAPSSADLVALAHAGFKEVVLPDDGFTPTPSITQGWGEPFTPTGAVGVSALATDGGLTQLATDGTIEPGRRAAMTLATLAFLHFEEPNAPTVRTVVVPLNVGAVSPAYLSDLLGSSRSNPFFVASDLTPSFNPSLIGANASPVTRVLVPAVPSFWSSANVATLQSLLSRTNSYLQAIASPTQTIALQTYSAEAEQVGDPGNRQSALDSAATYLNQQLSGFRIDNSTITLTGTGSDLPITLFSRARYPVTVVLHLIGDRLTFPKGENPQAVTLSTSTKPLRIPVTDRQGQSLTLQVQLTTPDGKIELAHAAIQVRVAGNSVVGYLLSGASLFVLAWWWLRSYRRKSRGRHAR